MESLDDLSFPGDRGAQTGDSSGRYDETETEGDKSHPLGKSSTEEVHEDISRNGIGYLTLKGAMHRLRRGRWDRSLCSDRRGRGHVSGSGEETM